MNSGFLTCNQRAGNKLNVNSTLKNKSERANCSLLKPFLGKGYCSAGIPEERQPVSSGQLRLLPSGKGRLLSLQQSSQGHVLSLEFDTLGGRATSVLILQGCQQEGGGCGCCLVLRTQGFQLAVTGKAPLTSSLYLGYSLHRFLKLGLKATILMQAPLWAESRRWAAILWAWAGE